MADPQLDDPMVKDICGALNSCIAAHGPITASLIGSAAKRIAGALRASRKQKAAPSCGNCWFCGIPLVSIGNSEDRKTRYHLTPRCRGGVADPGNTVDACLGCNNEKGRLTLEEYRAVITYRKGSMATFWGEVPTNHYGQNAWATRAKESIAAKLTMAAKEQSA